MSEEGTTPGIRKRRIALSIAGFDPSSGAGTSADIQVFAAHEFFGTSALTALTAQSTLGVATVQPVDTTLLDSTLRILQADLPPSGIKIGMVATAANAACIAKFLTEFHLFSPGTPVVFDPVLRSSSGASLLEGASVDALAPLLELIPWITPNWEELAILSSQPVGTEQQMQAAVAAMAAQFPALNIVATGGDQLRPRDFVRLATGETAILDGQLVETTSTHGTGCAFSSALLCALLLGKSGVTAVQAAKDFVTEALRQAPGIGHGRGPLELLWPMRTKSF